jgi:hypothetical protein
MHILLNDVLIISSLDNDTKAESIKKHTDCIQFQEVISSSHDNIDPTLYASTSRVSNNQTLITQKFIQDDILNADGLPKYSFYNKNFSTTIPQIRKMRRHWLK